MLDQIRKGQRWLTAIFVFSIGIVFVFFIGLGGPLESNRPSGNAVVELGEIRLDVADFQRSRAQQEARLREGMGDQYDPKMARDFLDSQTLSTMIEAFPHVGEVYVFCYETVGSSLLVATNIFVEEFGSWKLVHHHAGLCNPPSEGLPDEADPGAMQ